MNGSSRHTAPTRTRMTSTPRNNGATAITNSATATAAQGLVETNSVQSQFASLTNKRDVLQRTIEDAERERKVEASKLQTLRKKQSFLTEQLRVAHTTLGTERKRRDILQEEKTNLNTKLKAERQMIEQLNHNLQQIQKKEKLEKEKYVKDMTSVNDDTSDALRQLEEQSWGTLVSTETVNCLLEKLSAAASSNTQQQHQQQNMSAEEFNTIKSSMEHSYQLLKGATAKLKNELEHKECLEKKIHDLRNKAMKGQGATEAGSVPLGELELNELERIWDQCEDSPPPTSLTMANCAGGEPTNNETVPMQQSINMNLFYGGNEMTQCSSQCEPASSSHNDLVPMEQ